jgi:hypothetical protein
LFFCFWSPAITLIMAYFIGGWERNMMEFAVVGINFPYILLISFSPQFILSILFLKIFFFNFNRYLRSGILQSLLPAMVQHLPTNISIDGELLYVSYLFILFLKYLYCSFGRGNFVATNLLYIKKMEGSWDLLRYIKSITYHLFKQIHLAIYQNSCI